jgi:predicted MPP superfamily phosphohydrolase
MSDPLDTLVRFLFPALALITWAVVPAYAWARRGRRFAIFSAIVMGMSLSGALVVHARLPGWVAEPWLGVFQAAMAAGMAAAALHYGHLVRARMRGRAFRWLVSVPGQAFIASSLIATFWVLGLALVRIPLWALGQDAALAALAPLDLFPYVVGVVAAFTSPRPLLEVVRMRLGEDGPADFTRVRVDRERQRRRPPSPPKAHAPEPTAAVAGSDGRGGLPDRPLRIVQITDPHLGPWQPVERLRALVDRLIDHDPDLVLLTGDFLTMESNATPGALATALSPLQRVEGRCYAIFGNHDHEAPDEVRHGLGANGVRLLVDEGCVHESALGPVQIIGADYTRHDRRGHLAELLAAHPRLPGHLRLLMLHDPSAFHELPEDEHVDLVLSGHTHGGQVGLVSFGLDWTVLSRSRWPDHGLFARGPSRLYVHRGTGFYGFPLRIGVPGEASVLELEWQQAS